MEGTAHQDVVVSSSGLTASFVLAEPNIFLSGFSKQEQAQQPPALLRGSLVIRVTKPTKIKAINLNFKGISRTEWPEGIPNDKFETSEVQEVFSHEWRLFSTQSNNADSSSGAHSVIPLDSEQKAANTETELSAATSPHIFMNQNDVFTKGYRMFNPAEYIYNFELILPQKFPETLKCNFGQIRWAFNLSIERHGAFKPRLTGQKEITLLRTLGPSNLEYSEPIVISRDWEDLLHYEIIIAGKAFAIGQSFNVAFALVPLAKLKCHRIRIYITEHTEYFCRNHRIHRVEPSHKFLLLEKKSPEGSHGNLLNSVPDSMSGLTEFEFEVAIPENFPSRREYLRPNANTENIKVYHWIKAVMRLSRDDYKTSGDPKCYEVSIDSPVTLVDPRTLQINDLPDYLTAKQKGNVTSALKPYQDFIQKSPGMTIPGNGTALEHPNSEQVPSNRAILFARQPSIAPPPFDADIRPPELLPPQYDSTNENVISYEQRYEEYLFSTGRLPLSENRATDISATLDSNSSGLIQSSDSLRDSVGGTFDSETSASASDNSAPKHTVDDDAFRDDNPRADSQHPDSVDNSNETDTPFAQESHEIPVFSEIIWSEDNQQDQLDANEEMIDPRQVQTSGVNNESRNEGPVDDVQPPPKTPTTRTPEESSAASPNQTSGSNNNVTLSRSISKRSPLVNNKTNFNSRSSMQHHVQKLRVSGSSSGSSHTSNFLLNNLTGGRRPSSHNSRLSLKGPGYLNHGTGSSVATPWTDNNSNNNGSFGESWLDRRDSVGSIISSSSPRYFRQSSLVSIDVTRQGEYLWREPRCSSRVGEIQEVQGWCPVTRTNSEASVAVSIAEYQSLHNDGRQPPRTPLLGGEESEVDISLEWERDFEDYDLENDRRSIASTFYTVLTP